jgi:probable HAF family extracellular repeat protein
MFRYPGFAAVSFCTARRVIPSRSSASEHTPLIGSGTIVGDSKNGAFIYEAGVRRLLKRLSARLAYSVNDAGDVVGLLETVTGDTPHRGNGFLFTNNTMIDLGTPDGDPGAVLQPLSIDNQRQIAGFAFNATRPSCGRFCGRTVRSRISGRCAVATPTRWA